MNRARIQELENSVQTKDETFVWCASRICQKRSGSTVVRNYFQQGFKEGTTDYFFTRDHLGSVREVVGSDGTTVTSRVSYDPWGKTTETGSGALTDFGYTGHYFDRSTRLGLTWYRSYDSLLGRWLSTDPIGLRGGLNLYGYVTNNPTNLVDPAGKQGKEWTRQCLADCAAKYDYAIKDCRSQYSSPGSVKDFEDCLSKAGKNYMDCRALSFAGISCENE